MITIQAIRASSNKLVFLGSHGPIIQSILDFDYLSGKAEASVVAVITARRGFAKYFYGRREILIPTFTSVSDVSFAPKSHTYWFFNTTSGRRTLSSTLDCLSLPHVFSGGVLFAEGVPELHSLELIHRSSTIDHRPLIIGPASVGLVIPKVLKVGPVAGITPTQVEEGQLTSPGHIAVISGSGGMTNELVGIAVQSGHRLSFALSFGGDRFPVLSPRDAFLLAESDPETRAVLYYGELGGEDEYDLVRLKEEGKFTKPVVAHIAGTVASLFPESPQFGHAKAKADKKRTTALAKRQALKQAGFQVSESLTEFIELVNTLQ